MKRKSIIQGFLIFVALILAILTSGCATTNFATTNTTSKIKGRMDRKTLTTWDKYYPCAISNANIEQHENARSKYTIDAGRHKIQIAYTGNRGYFGKLRYAGPVNLEFDFAPNGDYQIDGESFDKDVYFIIRDRRNGIELLKHGPVDVVLLSPRSPPMPSPVFVSPLLNLPPLFLKKR